MGQQGTDRQIDNIEFAVADIARSKAFYGGAFGWSFTEYGPQYCEFTDGRLTGGLTTGTARPGGPLIILYADDLEYTERLAQLVGLYLVIDARVSDIEQSWDVKPKVSAAKRLCKAHSQQPISRSGHR